MILGLAPAMVRSGERRHGTRHRRRDPSGDIRLKKNGASRWIKLPAHTAASRRIKGLQSQQFHFSIP
jgi:hypothetical protein